LAYSFEFVTEFDDNERAQVSHEGLKNKIYSLAVRHKKRSRK